MSAVTRLADLTREAARMVAGDALLLLPLGATEQHGPHLPVATDTLLVEAVATRAAERLLGRVSVVVAPVLTVGSSAHHLPFGATLSLTTQTYFRVLMDIGRSAVTSGFRRLFFLNGHGGNHELAQLAARDLAVEHPIVAGAGSWWTMARSALLAAAGGLITEVPGHAGGFETAAILDLAPHLVVDPPTRTRVVTDLDALNARAEVRAEAHGWWPVMDGFTDSPADGTPELGEAFLAAAVDKVAADLAAFYDSASTW